MKRRFGSDLACAALLAITAMPAFAQDDPAAKPVPPVSVPVLVRDRKGGAVAGLTAANFTIKVGDAAQTIGSAKLGPGPVTYGLVVDVSRGQRHALAEERRAGQALIDALRPGDGMFIVQFSHPVELLTPPTADRGKLQHALDELGTASPTFQLDEPPHADVEEEGRKIRGLGTSLNDAVFLAADDVLSKADTRRVLLVMSDGVDDGSKLSMSDTTESLERNGVLVYTMFVRSDAVAERRDTPRNGGSNGNGQGRNGGIGFPGSYPGGGGGYPGGGYPGSSPGGTGNGGSQGGSQPSPRDGGADHRPSVDGEAAMRRLAENSGGRLLDTGRRDDAASVVADLDSTYWVSFVPTGAAARHGYHPFDVTVAGSDKGRKVDVSAPVGYYGN